MLEDALHGRPAEISLLVITACFMLSFLYCHPGHFSSAWSDTIAILAVLAGTVCGEALSLGFKGMLSLNAGKYISTIIGLVLLISTKRLMKSIFHSIFGYKNVPKERQPIPFAVVQTFFTYFNVVIIATFFIPTFVI